MEYQIRQWRAEAEALVEWGCAHVGMPEVASNITLLYNNRMRTTMGRAWTNYGSITQYVSPEYVQVLNTQTAPGGLICFCIKLYERIDAAERKRNILHELAHILANLKANEGVPPGKARSVKHGRPWKAMMHRLGLEPVRCHKADTNGLKRKQARYRMYCPDRCGWSFTFAKARRTRRINAAKRGATRRCPHCKAQIRLEHWQDTREVDNE